MPGDMLLRIARYWYGRFDLAVETQQSKTTETPAAAEKLAYFSDRALTAATKAAPYFHPTMMAVKAQIGANGDLTLEDLVRASMTKRALLIQGSAEEVAFMNGDDMKPGLPGDREFTG